MNDADFAALSKLPDRIKLPFVFDAYVLAAEVEALLLNEWTAHFVPQHYAGDWSVLPLRAPAGAEHPISQITSPPDCKDWVDTEWLKHCPVISDVLARFETPLGAVRLMRLGPGSQIHEHQDHDLSAEYGMARMHIPISSNADVSFRVNYQPVEMNPGECWYLRLSDPHSVDNRGATARIHLVIDAEVNDWLAQTLQHAAPN
jgi:mannose-6-phosphate isomerase-like protein (cupin superfamily)